MVKFHQTEAQMEITLIVQVLVNTENEQKSERETGNYKRMDFS